MVIQKKTIIAVGDIHGMARTLELLIKCLEKEFLPDDSQYVFLVVLVSTQN